jgi:hypothetical protein
VCTSLLKGRSGRGNRRGKLLSCVDDFTEETALHVNPPYIDRITTSARIVALHEHAKGSHSRYLSDM